MRGSDKTGESETLEGIGEEAREAREGDEE